MEGRTIPIVHPTYRAGEESRCYRAVKHCFHLEGGGGRGYTQLPGMVGLRVSYWADTRDSPGTSWLTYLLLPKWFCSRIIRR